MSISRVSISIALVLFALPACTKPTSGPVAEPSPTAAASPVRVPASCTSDAAKPGQSVRMGMRFDSAIRHYWLNVPSNYDCTPRPLLVGLHGYFGNGLEFQKETQIADPIDKLGYIGLFPTGLPMGTSPAYPEPYRRNVTSFNDIDSHNSSGPDGRTCGMRGGVPSHQRAYDYGVYADAPESGFTQTCHWGTSYANDEGFLRAMIAKTEKDFTVNTDRVYLTGFSQGAQTTQSLAWRMADVFTAVSPHHGFSANGYARAPKTPVDFLQVWSTEDRIIPGTGRPSPSDGMIYDSAAETLKAWVKAQGCSKTPVPYPTSNDGNRGWVAVRYPNCDTGATVVSASWDGPHFWGGVQDPKFETTTTLEFFEKTAAS